jgi:hypothetical protein
MLQWLSYYYKSSFCMSLCGGIQAVRKTYSQLQLKMLWYLLFITTRFGWLDNLHLTKNAKYLGG